jgi:hypothetical protein
VFQILVNTSRRHGKREARMNEELAAGSTVDPARFRGNDGPDWPPALARRRRPDRHRAGARAAGTRVS